MQKFQVNRIFVFISGIVNDDAVILDNVVVYGCIGLLLFVGWETVANCQYRFHVMEIIVFLSGNVETDIDILVT